MWSRLDEECPVIGIPELVLGAALASPAARAQNVSLWHLDMPAQRIEKGSPPPQPLKNEDAVWYGSGIVRDKQLGATHRWAEKEFHNSQSTSSSGKKPALPELTPDGFARRLRPAAYEFRWIPRCSAGPGGVAAAAGDIATTAPSFGNWSIAWCNIERSQHPWCSCHGGHFSENRSGKQKHYVEASAWYSNSEEAALQAHFPDASTCAPGSAALVGQKLCFVPRSLGWRTLPVRSGERSGPVETARLQWPPEYCGFKRVNPIPELA